LRKRNMFVRAPGPSRRNRLTWAVVLNLLGILCIYFFFFNYIPTKRLGGALDFGILFPLALGCILIAAGLIRLAVKKYIFGKITKRLLVTGMLMGVLLFLFVEGLIIRTAVTVDPVEADYLVILGAGLANGDQISPTLAERLVKGLEYLNRYPKVKVVLSGGQGSNETITEAEGMKRFLVEQGIKEERILKEDKSTSTFENLKYTGGLLGQLDKKPNKTIMIITNDFHMFRSKFLAKRNGLTAYGIPSPTPTPLIPNYYVREFFAVIKSYLFDKG
jgi:uncharacterized SAM-binding protein YcdF (DUF218 family)